MLLAAGANPRLCNSAGRVALELALEHQEDELDLILVLREAQRKHDETLIAEKKEAAAAKAARPKIQIVWESDLIKEQEEAAKRAAAAAAAAEDEPDISDAHVEAAAEGHKQAVDAAALDALATKLFAWNVSASEDERGLGISGAQGASPGPAGADTKQQVDAATLDALASKLFAWNDRSNADDLGLG